jgi:hypothetical protein
MSEVVIVIVIIIAIRVIYKNLNKPKTNLGPEGFNEGDFVEFYSADSAVHALGHIKDYDGKNYKITIYGDWCKGYKGGDSVWVPHENVFKVKHRPGYFHHGGTAY